MVPDQYNVTIFRWSSRTCRLVNLGSNPTSHPLKFFHFLSLVSDLHPRLSFFFSCRNKDERKLAAKQHFSIAGGEGDLLPIQIFSTAPVGFTVTA